MNETPLNSVPLNGAASFDGSSINIHTLRGMSRLVHQFKGKPNIEKLLGIFLSELDELEKTIVTTVVVRQIDSATNQQLDSLGEILGRTRDGFGDFDYRSRLKLQIGINTSQGNADKILTVWKAMTGSEIVSISESFPAQILLTAQTSSVDPLILAEVGRVTPAGVGANYIIANGVPFGFADSDGKGFGTLDDNTAGGTFISYL